MPRCCQSLRAFLRQACAALQSLVMGIAMASNVGGMTSPISSPQNIFAISLMAEGKKPPSWLSWFLVAIPVSCAVNVLIWLYIVAVYKPAQSCSDVRPLPRPKDRITPQQVRAALPQAQQLRVRSAPSAIRRPSCSKPFMRHWRLASELALEAGARVHPHCAKQRSHALPAPRQARGRARASPRPASAAPSAAQVAVVAVSVVTVVLWCLSTAWSSIVGNQGIVALLPLVAFFGFGILDKDDFNSFLWHVVMLAQVRHRTGPPPASPASSRWTRVGAAIFAAPCACQ